MGIVYLDRNDIRLLPGAGLTWTPSANSRVDPVFPRPKIEHRMAFSPSKSRIGSTCEAVSAEAPAQFNERPASTTS